MFICLFRNVIEPNKYSSNKFLFGWHIPNCSSALLVTMGTLTSISVAWELAYTCSRLLGNFSCSVSVTCYALVALI